MAWATNSVSGYERGDKERSRQYARPGIHKSIPHQYLGKAGEVAVAIYLNRDPQTAIDWSPTIGPPWDIRFRGLLIDVKATNTDKLIWPVTKPFLETHDIDIFVLATRVTDDTFILGGWVPHSRFVQRHFVAKDIPRLDDGTKYMNHIDLWPITDLLGTGPGLAIRAMRQFEYISGNPRWLR